MKKYDITPAGFIVVVVLGLMALWFAFVTGWLYLHGNTDEAKDAAVALGATTTALTSILARTRNDPAPAGTAADPLTVKTADTPLEVTPAREASPSGTPGWLTADAGHADAGGLLYLAVGLIVCLVILRVFHLI